MTESSPVLEPVRCLANGPCHGEIVTDVWSFAVVLHSVAGDFPELARQAGSIMILDSVRPRAVRQYDSRRSAPRERPD